MTASRVAWDELPDSIATLGEWRIGVLFEPFAGEATGGDRFALSPAPCGALAFYLADAPGHGRRGARFWQWFGSSFVESWQRFASAPSELALIQFARDVNDALHVGNRDGMAPVSSELCLAAGWISGEGSLVVAIFGLGIHVCPVSSVGVCRPPPEVAFGLRLGWIPSSEWPRHENALVIQRISGLQRLWLASDAFFGDDHWDPEGALRRVEELGLTTTGLTMEETLAHVTRLPHSGDDATFVILERAGT